MKNYLTSRTKNLNRFFLKLGKFLAVLAFAFVLLNVGKSNAQTQSYSIQQGQLVNCSSTCGSNSWYNGCSGSQPGFTWNDVLPNNAIVTSITIQISIGVECAPGTRTTTLNGFSEPSFDDLSWCQCSGSGQAGLYTITVNNGDYVLGGSNTFLISNPASCLGYCLDGGLNAYAQVNVNYAVNPTITFFSATSGCVGDQVDIEGSNFTNVTSVLFNGVNASFTINNDNDITATVPFGATTGMITVCSGNNCANTSSVYPYVFTINGPNITFCPGNVSQNNDPGACSAVVFYPDATTDNNSDVITYSQNSGTSFPVGTTTVTVTATNNCGASTCSFTVTVNDVELPVLVGCPSDMNVNTDPDLCSAVVTFDTPTATDNCNTFLVGNLTFNYTGSEQTWMVPAGVTSITVDLAGASGGNGSSNYNSTTDAGGAGGRVQGVLNVTPGQTLYIEVGGQGVSGDLTNIPPGGFNGGGAGDGGYDFFFGASFTGGGGGGASDIRSGGNALSNRAVVAGGGGGAGYNYFACCDYDKGGPGGGNTGGDGYSDQIQSGAYWSGFGGSQSAGGAGGNGSLYGYCSSPAGSLGVGSDVCTSTYNAGGGGGGGYYGGGAGVWGGAGGGSSYTGGLSSVSNNAQGTQTGNGYVLISYYSVSPTVALTSGLPSGSTFPVGTTTECFTATDASGNTSQCCFNVTVTDNQAPSISCPGDQVRNTDPFVCTYSTVGTEFDATYSDNCSVTTSFDLSGATFGNGSGSLTNVSFFVGTTTVVWTATDANGNTATCSFDVTVLDAPTIFCPGDITFSADQGLCSASNVDIGSASAFDACGANIVSVTSNSPGTFNLGVTVVTWTAVNDLGNSSTCTQNVTVIDDQPPVFSGCNDITASADQGLCSATVFFNDPTVTDNCGGFVYLPTTVSFNYSGGLQSWVVPSGVSSITVDVAGAAGGDNTSGYQDVGGLGGRETGEIAVTAGNTLYISVGGVGQGSNFCYYCNSVGGWPGGGAGGSYYGGAGGGYSSISTTPNFIDAIFVAGGGGGAGDDCGSGDWGGAGGGLYAGAGWDCYSYGNGATGQGGTQYYGGVGSTYNCSGTDGSFGQGGNACPWYYYPFYAGGGGGGWYGGGAGSYGGGGGGSNYPDPFATNVNDYSGVQSGNGYVYITYQMPVNSPYVVHTSGLTSGSTFPVGTSTECYTATDASGNTSQCCFNITVIDDQVPVITCPSDITVNTDQNVCTAVVCYTLPVATDNCASSGTQSFNYTGSLQNFTVPSGITSVTIDAQGATGGNSSGFTPVGGNGARMVGTFAVSSGQVLNVLVGQAGGSASYGAGGGGGSFVTDASNNPLLVAGGGGGVTTDINNYTPVGSDAVTGTTGQNGYSVFGNGGTAGNNYGLGGVNGNGATNYSGGNGPCAGNGGGFYSNGAPSPFCCTSQWGYGYLNGGAGGPNCAGGGNGGYGGGGGSGNTGGGGGGGYSGGGGSWDIPTNGGGGASYNGGSNQSNTGGYNSSGNGLVLISWDLPLAVTLVSGQDPCTSFPIGTTTNVYMVTDNSGNTATCSFNVTVVDAPTITCPADVTVNADQGLCSASNVDIGTATAVDLCGGTVIAIFSDQNSNTYNVGTTIVTWTAINDAGNSSTCTQNVVVIDNQPPVFSNCPGDISVNADQGLCSSTITFDTPTATDNCNNSLNIVGGSFTFNYTGSQQSWTVPAGVTSITVDLAGGQGGENIYWGELGGQGGRLTGVINVTSGQVLYINAGGQGSGSSYGTTYIEQPAPGGYPGGGNGADMYGGAGGGYSSISTTPNLTDALFVAGGGGGTGSACGFSDLGGPGGASTSFGGAGTDCIYGQGGIYDGFGGTQNAGGAGSTYFCSTTSGSFGQGGNSCDYFTTGDNWAGGGGGGWYGGGAGGGGSGGGGSNYNDITATSVVNTAGSQAGDGYVIISYPNYSVTYPVVTQTSGLTSGSTFPVGTTTECWTAIDAAGNTAQCCFNIVVTDNQPPVITCPSDITVNTDQNSCSAVVCYDLPTATDNCSSNGTVTFNYTGSDQTWTVPAGIGSATVFTFGAGGAGGGGITTYSLWNNGGAGGGGASAQSTATVNSGDVYTVTIGAGGSGSTGNGTSGGTTTISGPAGTFWAAGGSGGMGGDSNGGSGAGGNGGSTGTGTVYSGGNGSGGNGSSGVTGTGGGGAGSGGAGTSPSSNCGVTGNGGGGTYPGGNGGYDSNCGFTSANSGTGGNAPGGGGSGNNGWLGGYSGGAGGNGYAVIVYSSAPSIALVSGQDPCTAFPIGTTTNVYVATDNFGNTATCSFNVTVLDAPTIICPSDVTVNADQDLCSASNVDIGTATGFDCDNGTVTFSNNSNTTTYNVGTTVVIWTATNDNGNTSTCAQNVVVIDNQPPVFSNCPSDISVSTDQDLCSAVVNFDTPIATDNCTTTVNVVGGSLTFNYTGSQQSWMVPAGVTSITVDAAGAQGGENIYWGEVGGQGGRVTGVISVTPGQTLYINAGGQGSGSSYGTTYIEQPAPGGFPGGGNGADYYGGGGGGYSSVSTSPNLSSALFVAGGGGGTGSACGFSDLGGPGGASTSAAGAGTDCIYGQGGIYDGFGGTQNAGGAGSTYFCSTTSGSFGQGGNSCDYFSTGDNWAGGGGGGWYGGGAGGGGSGGGGSNYNDISATSVVNTTGSQAGNGYVIISYPNSTLTYPVVTQTSGLASGSTFPVGTTTECWTAIDGSGNTAQCCFNIVVTDNQPPVITCTSDIIVNNDQDNCSAVVCYDLPIATDNCSSNGTLSFNYTGSVNSWQVPPGVTSVTISAAGAAGGGQTNYGSAGGLGAQISGTVSVNSGDMLNIIVGQRGFDGNPGFNTSGGGGGGSFVWDVTQSNNLLIAAGGGGGAGYGYVGAVGGAGSDTQTPTSGQGSGSGSGGSGGNGGAGGCGNNDFSATYPGTGGGGAGWYSNGGNGCWTDMGSGGMSPLNGGAGGAAVGAFAGPGGFGGGGDAEGNGGSGGGGGGFNGGGGGNIWDYNTYLSWGTGGGGGSFNGGSNQSNIAGAQSGNGYVVLSWTAAPVITLVSGQDPCTAFPVGTTTNVYMATDIYGNTATCSFDITVMDAQAPTITCPGDQTRATDASMCSYTAIGTEFDPTFADNCSGAVIDYSLSGATTGSGSVTLDGITFNAGVTSVTWTVTDIGGNTSTCSFNVTVNDGEVPVITCPADITQDNDPGNCNAVVTFTVDASDNCGNVTVVSTPASGSTFALGTTTVISTATDGSGFTSTCSFNVTVNDTETPVIICSNDITQNNDPGNCSAVVTFTVDATDNCGISSIVSNPASGSTFNVGTTTVTSTATDVNGNVSTCSFDVTVLDVEAPVITCSGNLTQNADQGLCSTSVTFTVTATDNCGATVVSTPASGSTFNVGTTTVTSVATDASGNTATCSFLVKVFDNQAPVISCPSNISQSTDAGNCTAVVTFNVTASDNCSISSVVSNPASGSTFSIGTTTVNSIATDVHGNTSTCSFSVTITDNEVPVITCSGNITQNADQGNCSAIVTFSVTATDNCGNPTVVSSPASGSTFNVGTTTVNSVATDGNGNTSACSFTVAVVDNQAPTITCPGNMTVNGNIGCNAIVTFTVNSSDNCGTPTVVSNPASGSLFLNGTTTVTSISTDGSGNTSSCSFNVTVVGAPPAQPGPISGPINVCSGSTQTYSISPVAGATSYTWTTPAGWTGTSTTTSITVVAITNSGNVTVTANNACGSSAPSILAVTVSAGSPAQPGVITGNTSPCFGSVQTYSITPVAGATNYIWTTPIGWTGTSTTTSITVTIGNSSGNVTVKASNACGNSPVRTLAVTSNHGPAQPGPITGPTPVCNGSTATYSISPVAGATSYNWTIPGTWSGTSTTTSITVTIGSAGGNVIVSANNACGTGPTRTLFVTVQNVPVTPGPISGPTTACVGSVQTYSIASVAGATDYFWLLPTGWVGSSTSTSITVTVGSTSGNIGVLSHNNCGYSNTTRTLAVSVSTAPGQPGAIIGNTTVCQGSTQTYHISAVAGATSYTWTLPSGWNGTSSTISITTTAGSSSGNVTVVANNSCGSGPAQTLAVTVNTIPAQPGAISGNTPVCQGTVQTYSVTPVVGATSYTWTKPATGWSGTSTTNSITVTLAGNAIGGNVTVKAVNSCGSSPVQTLAVTVNTVTAVTITGAPGNYNFCSQVSPTYVRLMASAGYSSYVWSPSGGNSQTATVSSVNTFTVTATNGSGCTTTASKVVTNNCALPTSLATTNITGTSAKATWVQSQCAVNYTIQISVHGLNTWTSYTVSGNNYTFTGLSLSTSYDWRIQTNCNSAGTINSGYSAIMTFTTLAQRMAEDGNAGVQFNVYPNPADALVNIAFSSLDEGAYSIKLVDMLGRVVKSDIINAGPGENTYVMNLDGIAKAVYTVVLQKGDNISKAKLVVQ